MANPLVIILTPGVPIDTRYSFATNRKEESYPHNPKDNYNHFKVIIMTLKNTPNKMLCHSDPVI
jgi:hypothetical protein